MMNNVKGIAIANDGAMKRIAITYDVIDKDGKVIESNKRINRVVTDKYALDAIDELQSYAQSIVDSEE